MNDEVFANSDRERKERKLNSNAVATSQKQQHRVNGFEFLPALDGTKPKVSSVLTTKIDGNNDQEEDHNKKLVHNQHDRSFKPYMDEQKQSVATPGKYRHRHVSTIAAFTPATSGPLKKRLKMRYSLENPLLPPFTPSGFYDLTPGPISFLTSTIPSTSKAITSDIKVQPLRLPFADILSSNTKSAESRISNKQSPMLLKAPVVALTSTTTKAPPLSASIKAYVNTKKNETNFTLLSVNSGSACSRISLPLQAETTKNETSLVLSSEDVESARNGIDLPAYRTRGNFPPVLPALTHRSLMTKEPTGFIDLPNRDIYICLIRVQLEFFDATPEDVAICKSKGVYAFDGQIGMRCKHCCCIPVAFRQKGSLVFARKLYTLYNYFNKNENNSHLKSCPFVPEATKKEIDQLEKRILLQEVVSLRNGLGYWMQSAKDEGVVETNEGLRFKAPPLQAQLASDLPSSLASNKSILRMLEPGFTHQPIVGSDSYPFTQTENQVSEVNNVISSSLSLSSDLSSSSSSSHSSRIDNLSTRRKKSNSKPNNFYANEDTKNKHWSKQEDKMLRFEVNKFVQQQQDGGNNDNSNINWKEISMSQSFRRTRSIIQCKNRWYNHLQPHIKKGNWSKDEDDYIKKMVSQVVGFGNWAEIGKRLSHRIPTQIRDRYINVLDPNIKPKKTPWTEEEDQILSENQQRLGNMWTDIRKKLPGRTQLDVKNRYYNKKRKLARY